MDIDINQKSPHFLELLTVRQAADRGIYLNDKAKHGLLMSLSKLSNISHIRKHEFYYLDQEINDVGYLDENELKKIIESFIDSKLLVQLFIFEYKLEEKEIILRPLLLAMPAAVEQTMIQIYNQLIKISANSIMLYYENLQLPTKTQLHMLLEGELKENKKKSDIGGTLLDLNTYFQNSNNFKFELTSVLKNTILKDLHEYLKRNEKAIILESAGILPRNQEWLSVLQDVAGAIIEEKIIINYKNRPELNRQFEELYLKRNLSESEVEKHDVLVQEVKVLAEFLKSKGLEKLKKGMLPLEIILALENYQRELLQEKEKRTIEEEFKKIYNSLVNYDTHWSNLILFYTDDDIRKLPAEVWEKIIDMPELIYVTWESEQERVSCLAACTEETMRHCVDGMLNLPEHDYWKVLVLRAMADIGDSRLQGLFQDKQFVRVYGQLLRSAYLDFIPWIYRILLNLGFHFVQDRAFHLAKLRISELQEKLRTKNQRRREESVRQRQLETTQKEKRLKDIVLRNQLLDTLELYYFEDLVIPSIETLLKQHTEIRKKALLDLLKSHNFQLFKKSKKDENDSVIVMFPADQNWRVTAQKVITIAQENLKRLNLKSDLSTKELKYKTDTEFILKKLTQQN